jgi:hypothetical protein
MSSSSTATMRRKPRPASARLARAAALVTLTVAGLVFGQVPAGASATDACPNAVLRAEQNSERLPDCRAYEMVSPADKNGQGVYLDPAQAFSLAPAARDGSRVSFFSFGAFADADNAVPLQYLSSRGLDGWQTKQFGPSPVAQNQNWFELGTSMLAASRNLEVGVFITRDALDPLDQDGTGYINSNDLYAIHADGTREWISRGNSNTPDTEASDPTYDGISGDGSHILFHSEERLVPEATAQAAGPSLYDRADGHTFLVNVDNTGALINQCGATVINVFGRASGTVSTDGSRVAFTSPAEGASGDPSCSYPAQIYLRTANATTVNVSHTQRDTSDPAGTQPAQYQAATEDSSKIYFISDERLTNDAPAGSQALYEYDATRGHLSFIADNVFGVVGLSRDGSHIYYVAQDQGVPGETNVGPNIYLYNGGVKRLVMASAGADLLGASGNVETSQSGDAFAFVGNNGFVYFYNTTSAQAACVNCNPYGPPDVDPRHFGRAGGTTPHNISDDGKRLIFSTMESLVPEDVNGREDVYEYEDGTLQLISPGTGNTDADIVDMSADGRDIFFVTPQALLPQDADGGDRDIYDARIDGGFPRPPSANAPCTGDDCRGPVSGAPSLPSPASVTFSGAADVGLPTAKIRVRKHPARGSRLRLSVTVPTGGRIRVSGRGVRAVTRRVTARGTYVLTARLSPSARRALKRRRALKVSLHVGYTPTSGRGSSATVTVTVKP